MGLAQSIQHPGENFTRFLHTGGIDLGKPLQLLQEALPGLARIGIVWKTGTIRSSRVSSAPGRRARAGGDPRLIPATNIEELDGAFATLAAEKIQATVVIADALWFVRSKRAAEIGLHHRVAAVWGHLEIAEAGGLMAYAPDIVEMFRQAGGYAKKILDGAKPGDLPLQYPSRWTLVVNLKTARAIE
jgi:ABC-type uncharacterized transport system substrate-binding protein